MSIVELKSPHERKQALVSYTQVLVADEDAINQIVAKAMLEQMGCQVDLANNGREALALAQSRRYDLILMACSMPLMDGIDATILLRRFEDASGWHTPVVAVTGNSTGTSRRKCLEAGMDDYITKPIGMNHLRAALKVWIKAVR